MNFRSQPVFERATARYTLLLCLIVCLVWCALYDRWSLEAWRTPVAYGGDAWWGLVYAKALSEGEIPLIWPKNPHSLGAPFDANWNDYPSVEEGVAAWWALLTRFFGLALGENFTLLSAHLLSALSFFFVCRQLRYHRLLSAAGGILFSFSQYPLWRGVSHLGLTFYWHVPLGILVTWWCVTKTPFPWRSRKWFISVGVAVAHGIQNPYYTGIFLQLLVWAALICLVRRENWRRVLMPLLLCLIVFGSFFVMNLDTFYSNHVNGPNTTIVNRSYSGLEIFALKPLELLVPVEHRLSAVQQWTKRAYLEGTLFTGEIGSAYLGLAGLLALGWLAWRVVLSLARREEARRIPSHLWPILWTILYSVVGGLNGVIGLFGMILYRGTNRYSIVILAFLLLFAVGELNRMTRRLRWSAIAAFSFFLTAFALWEQTTQRGSEDRMAWTRVIISRDRGLVKSMESKLPAGAMVFQVPVREFPESGPLLGLGDYEQFRPYLQSHHLRYSYGSDKGRARERWQFETERLGPRAMIDTLEKYGFGAVLVAKKGYVDEGMSLLAGLHAAGKSDVLAESPDFVCLRLNPATLPNLPPAFDDGWFSLEGDSLDNWRWSRGSASVVLYHNGAAPRQARVKFGVASNKPQQVKVSLRREELAVVSVSSSQSSPPLDLMVTLKPGKNYLRFQTDAAGEKPPNGDTRPLAFNLVNFTLD